jgi:glycosyltransferase involved in cell wall biosynthesis
MSRVDVIVPCYNYGEMLADCVGSVLSQEGVDVRVLVVDDASPDETETVGRRLAAEDCRVEFWRHHTNRGHIATYNEALEWVRADYCMILSADDLLTPRALTRATRVMDAHPEVGFTYGRDITFRYAPPIETSVFPRQCSHRKIEYGAFLEHACRLGQTGIQAPTVLVRSSVHRLVGGYRPELPHSGDTEIWLRLAAQAPVAELNADQAFRRLHARNMSLGYSPLSRLEEQKKAFDTHFALRPAADARVTAMRPVMNRTIAEASFWTAARAFDGGDNEVCEAFLAFAASIAPDVQRSAPWKRLRWKRRLGRTGWQYLQPLAARWRSSPEAGSHGR